MEDILEELVGDIYDEYDEIEEEDIILEDDKDKLFEKIKQLIKEIDEEEGEET